MALLDKKLFTPITKERNSIHKPVQATYSVFTHNSKTCFQIDTYGTSDRIMPEKISQSIQIDEDMAKELIKKLRTIFNID